MNNAGEEGISEGFRLAKSERAVPGGVGAEGLATLPLFLSIACIYTRLTRLSLEY